MAILSVCPLCGAKHKLADESKLGKKIRCRECGEPFVIKAAKSQAAKSQGAKPPARAKSGGAPAALPPRVSGLKAKKKKKAKPAEAEAAKNPKKRSKSKKKSSPAMVGGVSVLSLALLVGIPMMFSGGDAPMEAPASYSEFVHSVNSEFKIVYPDGWTVDSGGTQGKPVWAKFSTEDEDIKIRVRSSMGYSAMGDIAAATNTMAGGDGEIPEELAPVAQVHEASKDQYAEEYDGYQENAPLKIETGFGDSRVSEFTASGSFGSKIRGIRASMLGKNLAFTVICDCPEEDWEVCRAIFDKVIKSMSRG